MKPEPPSFTCPRCSRTSHHPKDVEEGYCGACHDWTGAGPGMSLERAAAILRAHRDRHPPRLTEDEAVAVADAFIVDVRTGDKTYDRTLTVIEAADEEQGR